MNEMTDKTMFVLEETSTLANLQQLIVGKNIDSSFIGRYVVVHSPDNSLFLCRVWKRASLHNSYCILDKTVEILPSLKKCKSGELYSSNVNETIQRSHIIDKDLEVIPKISTIKSLTFTIIFKDPWERNQWTNRQAALIETLKDLLKLFIITENSIVHLHKLKEFDMFGIHSVKILFIGIEGYGRVIKTTKVKVHSNISLSTYEQLILFQPNNFIIHIHSNAYQDFKMILNDRRRISSEADKSAESPLLFLQQVLLIGPGGCGKCSLLKKVCCDNDVVTLSLDVSDLLSLKYDERKIYLSSKLKLAQALSTETDSGLCMIIIKQIGSIMSKSGKSLEIMKSFLEEASRVPNVVIVATCDSPQSLDSSLRSSSKFSIELYLSIPDESMRFSIISHLSSRLNLSQDSCLDLARNTPGYVLSDLVLIVRRSLKMVSLLENQTENEIVNIIKSCIKSVQPTSIKGVIGLVHQSDGYNIDKIGGLKDIKKKLAQIIIWPILHSDAFKRMNVPPPSGVLLYGPPGCAKTSLVRAVASSCKTTFLSVSAADLYSPFVGDAEKTVTLLFQRARASAPTVLFIDEIDALVGSRSFREKGVQERVLSSFLTELDGVGFKKDVEHSINKKYSPVVIVIAATNRPHIVDSALLRPGRLDTLLYVPPPDAEQRYDILSKITTDLLIDKNLSLLSIAERTEHYSGADLVNLCREAGLYAVTVEGTEVCNIKEEHFDHALKHLKPSLSPEQILWYSQFTFG